MLEVEVKGIKLYLQTQPGLFSPNAPDRGTVHMLQHVEFAQEDIVLDLGCGYGLVGIYAASIIPSTHVYMTDIDPEAVAAAAVNLEVNGISGVTVVHGSAYDSVDRSDFTLILSNPPYVTAESMAILPAEYRHEPRLALAGGEDGLDFVHILLAQAAAHLTPQGLLVVEIGHNQYALEQAYPETSFIWLDTGYEEPSVFALARADLPSKTLTQGDFS